ncbi:MAG: hypothetical protein AAF787_09600 [Chloroflexota bacterium]
MSINQSSLPYYYETEQDPVTLANSVIRQQSWGYVVEPHSEISIDGKHHPLVFERLREMVSYCLEDYLITYANVHEWQYLATDSVSYMESVYGYRFYHDGLVRKSGERHLQPEVAVILGHTPQLGEIPAYIETVDYATLKKIIHMTEERAASAAVSNAWFALPTDVPRSAPPDVYQTLRQMRSELGIRATRGRGRMLQELMEIAGVSIDAGGWSLTHHELERRKTLAAVQKAAASGAS